jgi:S-ribosylhomocysteine lyase LuxS involved in autoinducer biosynthesis
MRKTITATLQTRKSLHTIQEAATIRGIEVTRIDLRLNQPNKVTFAVREQDEPDTLAAFARALR